VIPRFELQFVILLNFQGPVIFHHPLVMQIARAYIKYQNQLPGGKNGGVAQVHALVSVEFA